MVISKSKQQQLRQLNLRQLLQLLGIKPTLMKREDLTSSSKIRRKKQ